MKEIELLLSDFRGLDCEPESETTTATTTTKTASTTTTTTTTTASASAITSTTTTYTTSQPIKIQNDGRAMSEEFEEYNDHEISVISAWEERAESSYT